MDKNTIKNSATCTLQVDGQSQKVVLLEEQGRIKEGFLVSDPRVKIFPFKEIDSKFRYSPCPAIYSSLKRHRVWKSEAVCFKVFEEYNMI